MSINSIQIAQPNKIQQQPLNATQTPVANTVIQTPQKPLVPLTKTPVAQAPVSSIPAVASPTPVVAGAPSATKPLEKSPEKDTVELSNDGSEKKKQIAIVGGIAAIGIAAILFFKGRKASEVAQEGTKEVLDTVEKTVGDVKDKVQKKIAEVTEFFEKNKDMEITTDELGNKIFNNEQVSWSFNKKRALSIEDIQEHSFIQAQDGVAVFYKDGINKEGDITKIAQRVDFDESGAPVRYFKDIKMAADGTEVAAQTFELKDGKWLEKAVEEATEVVQKNGEDVVQEVADVTDKEMDGVAQEIEKAAQKIDAAE